MTAVLDVPDYSTLLSGWLEGVTDLDGWSITYRPFVGFYATGHGIKLTSQPSYACCKQAWRGELRQAGMITDDRPRANR